MGLDVYACNFKSMCVFYSWEGRLRDPSGISDGKVTWATSHGLENGNIKWWAMEPPEQIYWMEKDKVSMRERAADTWDNIDAHVENSAWTEMKALDLCGCLNSVNSVSKN